MKIGFIGLGNLGTAIAKRLLTQHCDLTVWNRNILKAEIFDAPHALSPRELISKCELVFTCLFDSSAVREVLMAPDGILSGDCNGKIIIDLTTNHFEQVLPFHQMCHNKNLSYLESPVLGSVVPATNGVLSVVVSGNKTAYEKATPYINKFGKDIYYLPKPGMASKMKVINNLVLGSFMATLAEAVVFGEKTGIDRETVINILSSGAGNSGVLNAKKDKILNDNFEPHFSAAAIYKDLHYIQDLARTLKRPLFTASVIKELFGLSASQKLDDRDFSVIYKILNNM